jgi:hypothetical protein
LTRDHQDALRQRLRALAAVRVRFGYRRLTVLLKREGGGSMRSGSGITVPSAGCCEWGNVVQSAIRSTGSDGRDATALAGLLGRTTATTCGVSCIRGI